MDVTDDVLVAIRRIFRALDLHSKRLVQEHGLTVPQVLVLRAADRDPAPTIGELAKDVTLSQATVTNIVIRLESRGMLERRRSELDKRRVHVTLTRLGREILSQAPSLLHDRFVQRFQRLHDWEQTQILSSLQRLASLMDAEDLEAAPVLIHAPDLGVAEDPIRSSTEPPDSTITEDVGETIR